MTAASNSARLWILALCLLLLAACSGGGGGGVFSSFGTVVDPAPSYHGATNKATLTSDNATAAAVTAFGSGRLGSAMRVEGRAAKALSAADAPEHPVLRVTAVMKQSLRRLDLPRVLKEKASAKKPHTPAPGKVSKRAQTYQVQGEDGGSVTYTMNVNDSTGAVYGTVAYHDYAARGVVVSGTADVMGTMDLARSDFSRVTMSFRSLSIYTGGYYSSIVGSVSWANNFASRSELENVNLVLIADSKTYWLNNYQVATTYGDTSLTQTMSGRYYDHDEGYIDLGTLAPIVANYGESMPVAGLLEISGASAAKPDAKARVMLSFRPGAVGIDADLDVDGSNEYHDSIAIDQQPPQNTAPVADAGPDFSVALGTLAALDGSASHDAEQDALSYSWAFTSCPNDACPALNNSGTATPSFIPVQAGDYTLRLLVFDGQASSAADVVKVTAQSPAPANPDSLHLQWQYGTFGTRIGLSGLVTADVDGDGTPEIITAASSGGFGPNTFWYVVKKGGGSYSQIWRSPDYGRSIVKISLAELTGDGKDDVVVGLEDGTIYVYDGTTLQLARTIQTAGAMLAYAVGDVDGDGKKEVVTSDGISVFVYSVESGAVKWLANCGGSSIAIGNVDADPAQEIVLSSFGGKGYVIDGVTKVVQWEYIDGFGGKVLLADLDGDGMQEIIGASSWYKITVFDADRKTPAWEIKTSEDIDSVVVADTDGDGVPEILYGDAQWGAIHAIDGRSHAEKWQVNSRDGNATGFGFADVDGDGQKELIWGSGGNSTGADHLYIAVPGEATFKWQSQDINGLVPVAVGDLDGDGVDDILMVTRESDSGYSEGVVHIFDSQTHQLKYRQKLGIRDWMGVSSVQIGDVDDDGKNEYVITTADLYTGLIQVYDGTTHALKRQSSGYDGNFFSTVRIGDVDGDGRTEIVAAQGREHTGAAGNYLIVFDGATMQEKWRSVDLGSYWGAGYDLQLADVDGDGHCEMILSMGDRLIVYDGVNHDLKALVSSTARALDVADADGDGNLEILAGKDNGKIDVLDGRTFALKSTQSTFSTDAVNALKLVDLDGDGVKEWVVASGGALTVLNGNRSLKARQTGLFANVGVHNQLAIRDTDGDGKKEIFIGSELALYQFR